MQVHHRQAARLAVMRGNDALHTTRAIQLQPACGARRRISKVFRAGVVLLAAGTLVAACGDSETSTSVADGASTTAAGPTADVPAIDRAWARTSPMATDVGAAYLTITSPVDDALIDVKVDPSIAAMAQLHEMAMSDMGTDTTMGMNHDGMGSATTMGGEMVMREVEGIDLPAGEAVQLKPGGYHIMIMQLAAPLQKGATIQLTLVFEKAGEIVVDFPVLDEAP